MRRRLLVGVGFVTGALGVTALLRRTAGRRKERVDLYYDDGSMISLADGSSEAERLLPLARGILNAARGAA